MNGTASHFERFIRRLHRRFVLLRAAEQVGTCLLIGSGGAGALLPLAWWRGLETWPIVLFCLGTGAAVGLLMAALRRPTRLQAAMEADRQLRLADLLGSALMIDDGSLSTGTPGERVRVRGDLPRDARSPHPNPLPGVPGRGDQQDPWAATVLAMAEARCRNLSAAQVLLHRWGSRAWGGTALVILLVLTLAMFSTRSAPTQAASQVASAADDLGVPRPVKPSVAYSPVRPGQVRRPSDPIDDSSAENPTMQTADATGADKTASANPASPGKQSPSAGDPNATGAGASGTSRPPAPLTTLPEGASASAKSGRGPTATGGQADSQTDDGAGVPSTQSGVAGTRQSAKTTPPWASPTWTADQQRAVDQMRAAPTYDPYRDLIRGYFER